MLKNLKDVILEKLKVDDIIFGVKFPIDGTFEEMIEFLNEQGFIDISGTTGLLKDVFNNEHKKCVLKFEDRFAFTDTSKEKISKNNPIFFIDYAYMYSVYYKDSNNNTIDIVENDKKAFMKELNKRFGW